MVYNVIGTMSGSSMDGLDIAYCAIEETGGKWSYQILQAECIPFDELWMDKLKHILSSSAKELLLTHTAFGHWMAQAINGFIERHQLEHKIHLIASHGHTVFHDPLHKMTFQMGDGSVIAALTKLPVVSDLRNMDIALGGQGAPIVPIGEKLFWRNYRYFLNLGGICNITIAGNDQHIAFDVCPANRVLNMLAAELGKAYDHHGEEAAKGNLHMDLLNQLNALDYYKQPHPKSLSNEYGVDTLHGIIQQFDIKVQDKLHTLCIHIAKQVHNALKEFADEEASEILVTGGGALNLFLTGQIQKELDALSVKVVIPENELIEYKEALVMALIGVLRWREEENVLASATGAARNSVGGALWMGHD